MLGMGPVSVGDGWFNQRNVTGDLLGSARWISPWTATR